MTPKQKAESLIEKFYWFDGVGSDENDGIKAITLNEAKQCALICADELKELADSIWEKIEDSHVVNYWQEVKQEIEKI